MKWNKHGNYSRCARLWYTRYWWLLGCGANFWPGLIYPIHPMQGKDSTLPVLTSTEGCNSPRIVIRFIQFHRNTPLNAYLLCAICNQFPCTTHDTRHRWAVQLFRILFWQSFADLAALHAVGCCPNGYGFPSSHSLSPSLPLSLPFSPLPLLSMSAAQYEKLWSSICLQCGGYWIWQEGESVGRLGGDRDGASGQGPDPGVALSMSFIVGSTISLPRCFVAGQLP